MEKIKDYYKNKNIQNAAIDIYWYGGEPTTMGVKMFSGMCDIINSTFKTYKVYDVCILLLQYFFTMGAHSSRLTPTNARHFKKILGMIILVCMTSTQQA
jgi:hypothetical protein